MIGVLLRAGMTVHARLPLVGDVTLRIPLALTLAYWGACLVGGPIDLTVVGMQLGRTTLTVAADAALWEDWSQTTAFLATGREEANPVLGAHPSPVGLAAYNVVLLSANTFAPRRWRPWVNVATLALELVSITKNRRYVGWRFQPF